MTNLFDYLAWRGDIDFSTSPFNEVDALLLSQISYIDFSSTVTGDFSGKAAFLSDVAKNLQLLPDFQRRCQFSTGINPRTMELFLCAAETKRFSSIKMRAFVDILDETREEQFSALTYTIGGTTAVVFRGTDGNVIGWKEDCHLSCMDEIPAQADALEYLLSAAKSSHGKIILAGHSKGGNLSIYAASKSPPKIQKRILTVYNFDGPGFEEAFFKSEGYLRVGGRIKTFVPRLSIVGMLFHHTKNVTVVTSGSKGIMQHDPISWQTGAVKFPETESTARESKYISSTVNGWIDGLSREQRSQFVDAVFDIFRNAKISENDQIKANPFESAGKLISAYTKMDSKARHALQNTVQLLIKSGFSNLGRGKNQENLPGSPNGH